MAVVERCPFCGGYAYPMVLEDYTNIKDGQRKFLNRFYYECALCLARTGYYDSAKEAKEAWNRRAKNGCL